MRQYDKNKSGRLEREEWSELRGSLRESDRNGDGIVTQEELAAKLSEYAQRPGVDSRSGGDSRSSGSRDSRGGSRDSQGGSSKSSVRFLTAHERLPKGLPDWFTEKDADEDGQVSMGEYASTWSDSVVQEFLKYDLNNDGIVTPKECLAVQPAESSRRR